MSCQEIMDFLFSEEKKDNEEKLSKNAFYQKLKERIKDEQESGSVFSEDEFGDEVYEIKEEL